MLAVLLLLSAVPPADLSAVGTVVSTRPGASVAVLHSGGSTRVVGVGDAAFGGRVTRIERSRVTLDFDGQPVELALTRGLSAAPAPAPTVAAAAPAAAADALVFERRELERRLGQETPRILAETTLVPVQVGSQVTGFTLSRIPEGTILTDAGLQPGDVLTHVNDVPIDSLATLIGLWPRMQTENSISAVVLRGGTPVTLNVRLR